MSLSHDHGSTWSNPVPVSVEPNGKLAPHNQFFPWIAVDGNGTFQAIWLDRRTDPNNHDITTFQATSTDDGQTWHNFQIGRALWNPDEGFFTSGAFIGDYSGLAANTTAVYRGVDRRHRERDRPDRHRRNRHLHERRDRTLSFDAQAAVGRPSAPDRCGAREH